MPDAPAPVTDPTLAPHVEALVEAVRTSGGGVSFVEVLEQVLASRGLEVAGDRFLGIGPAHLVICTTVSPTFTRIVETALGSRRIHLTPTTAFVYFHDGKRVNLPMANGGRRYRTPHWVPVVLNPGPPPAPRRSGMRPTRP